MIGCEGCKEVVGTPLADGEWVVATCRHHGADISYKGDSVHECNKPVDYVPPHIDDTAPPCWKEDNTLPETCAKCDQVCEDEQRKRDGLPREGDEDELEFEGKLVNAPSSEPVPDKKELSDVVNLPKYNGVLVACDRPLQFFNILKNLTVINEEYKFRFSSNELKVVAMDPSHVAMVKLILPMDFFDEWHVGDDLDVSFNVKELIKIVGKVGKSESMVLKYDSESTKLTWVRSMNGMKIPLTIRTLDPIDDEVPEPKIFFKAKARVLTYAVNEALLACDKVSEHVRIDIADEFIKFSSNGDMGEVAVPFEKGCDQLIDVRTEEDSYATYTLSYLKEIVRATKLVSEALTLEISTDMPIRIEAEMMKGELSFFTAPCIGVN